MAKIPFYHGLKFSKKSLEAAEKLGSHPDNTHIITTVSPDGTKHTGPFTFVAPLPYIPPAHLNTKYRNKYDKELTEKIAQAIMTPRTYINIEQTNEKSI